MDEKVLIVQYGEVAMRRNNRHIFISRLVSAIRNNIDDLGSFYVVKEQGRLIIESRGEELDYDALIPRVLPIFGLIGVCPGIKTTEHTIEKLRSLSLEYMKQFYSDRQYTFKVKTKRSNKKFPMISDQVSADIGEKIIEGMENMTVDVHNPEVMLTIEIRNDIYIYSKIIKAYGGLPYGSSGKAVSLLSGGIDSPVATWLAARRGTEVVGVYFHSPPYTSEWAKQKVKDLAERIASFTGEFKLYIVPFTEVQLYLLDETPQDKLTIFLKRSMVRCAEIIAKRERAQALVTGESIGQVASQTLQGMNAISSAGSLPVLRPLCGMDKQEIVDRAVDIGTYDISIRPYEDCCTIFVAKHPETRPSRNVVEKLEAKLSGLEELEKKAVDLSEIEIIG